MLARRQKRRMDASYGQRSSAFEDFERTWVVDAEGLRVTLTGRRASAWAWRDLRSIRLAWAPTRLKPWRREVAFDFGPADKVAFDNGHFAGLGDFEDRTPAFTAIVRAAIVNAREANPAVRFDLGAASATYWAQLIFAAAAFAVLAFVIIALPLPFWPWTAIAKLLIVAVLIPPTLKWIRRARPRRATAEDLFADLDRA